MELSADVAAHADWCNESGSLTDDERESLVAEGLLDDEVEWEDDPATDAPVENTNGGPGDQAASNLDDDETALAIDQAANELRALHPERRGFSIEEVTAAVERRRWRVDPPTLSLRKPLATHRLLGGPDRRPRRRAREHRYSRTRGPGRSSSGDVPDLVAVPRRQA